MRTAESRILEAGPNRLTFYDLNVGIYYVYAICRNINILIYFLLREGRVIILNAAVR